MKEVEWLLNEKYGGEKTEGFFADAQRLRAGEPLAYVIGYIPFLNCTIHLDSHPLIPRPETEFWVERAIDYIKKSFHSNESSTIPQGSPRETSLGLPWGEVRVLDLCAGSGCIGVAVAKAIPQAQVTFAEINEAHLPTISLNLKENNIDESHHNTLVSDLFNNVLGTFDFILTNPPYIDPALNRTEDSVTQHEPHEALFGGEAGLSVIGRIVRDAKKHLNPEGQLWLEHEPEQLAAIAALADQHSFVCQTHNDQYKVPRYSVLRVAQ